MSDQPELKPAVNDPRIAYFNALAAEWDLEEPSADSMVARLNQHRALLGLKPGQALLEVGCGTGKTTSWLVKQVAPGRVTAIDFAPQMLAAAQTKGIDADFACLDVCCDSLGSACYDVVLCLHSFPHFRDQPAALRNLAAALKPGGRLLVMHFAGSKQINDFHAGVDGPVSVDVLPQGDDWHALLAQAGLKQVQLIDREDLFFLEAAR